MKRDRLIVVLAVLFITSCTKKNEVHVTIRNFDAEVEQQQNLVFTFDKELVTDSLLNRWDTIPFIRFTPEVKGKFRWNTSKELMFSPLAGFKASTDYSCELQKQLLAHASNVYSLSEKRSFSFHTPYLSLNSATGYWSVSKKNAGTAALMVTLGFNYKVDPVTVSHLLHLSRNNESNNFEVSTTAVNNLITVVMDGISKDKVAQVPVKVLLDKGLKSVESSYATTQALNIDVLVPSPEKLEISSVTGEFVGTDAIIHVYTTQTVDEAGIKELITLDPKMAFTTEQTDNGFYIKGAFSSGQSYSLEIKKALKGLLGGGMDNDYKAQVSFGQMTPSVSFVNQEGIYLSSKSSKNVAINIVNIAKVHVTVYKVYENNIIHYLRNGRNNNYWYNEEGEYTDGGYNYNTYEMQYFGDPIFDRIYETKDLAKLHGSSLLNLTFDNISPYKGVYMVNVASNDDQWRQATKLVSISDIGLIVKKSDDEIHVFTNSIKTAEPMEGVKITLLSNNNQDAASVTTDVDGVAVFSNLKAKISNFKIGMITAHGEEDFNYLMLNDNKVNNSRFDVGGRRADETGLLAFMYGDRDIYRPGETIHLNTIVRNEQWQAAADLPVKMKILLPNGKEYKNMRATLNKQGAFETSVPLPVATVTGTYIAEIFTANDVLIESKNISVEEFMPDRIDVKLNLSKDEMMSGDSIKVSLTALNLFGPPAADRKYELEYTVSRQAFHAKGFEQYDFSVKTDNRSPLNFNNVIEGKTDKKGNGTDMFRASEDWKDQGLLSGQIFATVFDETGRPVNRYKSIKIFTQPVFYGIRMKDRYVDRGSAFSIPMIAVDKKGKAIATKAQIQVVRYDWHSAIEQDEGGGRYHYVSKKSEVILLDQTIDFTTLGYAFNFIPRESGEYEVRVKDPESEHYVAETFYSYGWGYTSNSSFRINPEGQVDIKTDKESYKVGDDANVVFSTPFNGKLLVTLECDNVIEYRYLTTEKKSAVMKIPIKESYMPNIYITATLFRPLDDGSIPLTVGHGFVSLKVEKDGTKIPVIIVAAEQSRSKTKQNIIVKTTPRQDVEVTIAVVDEGILALKNYETPDPHKFFYQKKALTVDAFDLYQKLLPDLSWKQSSVGGDGYNLEKRVNPLTNKRVQLVAFWSGILHTNANGEANYSIDIPQFSGDLRIMACAYKDKSFGSADKHMKVADPIVISPSIPRFLSPRDTLVMPVTISNTTNKTASAVVTLSLNGPMKVLGSEKQIISIIPKSEFRAQFKILADVAIGNGSIKVDVATPDETFTDKTEITVRPSTSLLKISESGEITGNQKIKLKHDFIPSSASGSLVISQNPMVQFTKELQYLVGYPYGCVEQTTSKAFPQIYFTELVKNMKYAFSTDLNPATNVQAAVNKLQGMQLYNGAMSYWAGGDYESWWGTVYATHFLIEAKKAGYDVNANVIDRAVSYMSQKVKEHETEEYYYDWNYNSWHERKIFSKENIYSLYIMALYGKADVSSMNYFKANIDYLALDSRYMLACTYLAVGDRKSYDELLPKSIEGEHSRNCFGGSFYSYTRDQAIVLNVLLETDPNNPQIPEMVRHLSQQLNKAEYLNTQEAAYSFLALGKFMKRLNAAPIKANITFDGKIIPFEGKDIVLTKGIAGETVKVDLNSKGSLFYFWQIEGLSKSGNYREEDKYLAVRKNFFDRFGRPVDIQQVKQGDLIVVKISLTNLEKSRIENIVVTDMLPAGFEIENPRLTDREEMKWIKDKSDASYFDVRDDRINFFTNIDRRVEHFYYLVRAVSLGNYRMGPVSADAMYNGEYHSYNGATTVRISE